MPSQILRSSLGVSWGFSNAECNLSRVKSWPLPLTRNHHDQHKTRRPLPHWRRSEPELSHDIHPLSNLFTTWKWAAHPESQAIHSFIHWTTDRKTLTATHYLDNNSTKTSLKISTRKERWLRWAPTNLGVAGQQNAFAARSGGSVNAWAAFGMEVAFYSWGKNEWLINLRKCCVATQTFGRFEGGFLTWASLTIELGLQK